MQLGRLGVWTWLDALTATEVVTFARRIETLGYSMLWSPEGFGRDPFSILTLVAANTTRLQMKMVLTRIGEGSRMAVTGDPSQIDLVNAADSGLAHAVGLLEGVEGVGVNRFTAQDIVRHPMVERIVRAYDADAAKSGRAI